MKTKQWSKTKLLKFSLISLLIFFLLLESVARIFFYIKFNGLHTSVYIQGSPLLVEDSATVYNNRPFYVDYEKRFQYNEEGMKSQPRNFLMPAKKTNELWVLLLGASAMEGMGSNKNGKWLDITNVADHPYHETIAAFLEADLQQKFPGKKIKVFNAGVSAYTLSQSIRRYDVLSRRYDFDWVISMDGVNEPDSLKANESMESYNRKQWTSQPSHYYPLKQIIPVTRHSAFFNLVKQELFYVKQRARAAVNKKNNFPERVYWANQPPAPLVSVDDNMKVKMMLDTFLTELRAFESKLREGGKNYLLLVQPHLAFRNLKKLSQEERALRNYYLGEHNDLYKFTFLKMAYDSVNKQSAGNFHIQTMDGVNEWPGWTFVDYCHFTTTANKKIAAELANFIDSGGKQRVFQP